MWENADQKNSEYGHFSRSIMITYLEFDEVLATFYDCVTKEVASGEKTAYSLTGSFLVMLELFGFLT